MSKKHLTDCRLHLNRLVEEHDRLLGVFKADRPLVKGSVYEMKTKCGKPGCRCETAGELHTAWRLSRSHHGRSQARCIPKGSVYLYQKLTRNYREFRRARARLVTLQQEMMALIDRMEAGRTQEPDVFKKER